MVSHWWMETAWLKHRHTAEEVHPLLVQLQAARGMSFMTIEHVQAVLDSKDPEALVRSWIGEQKPQVRSRRLGLNERICAWVEGNYNCPLPVSAPNAKYCSLHARRMEKEKTRIRVQKHRNGGSVVTEVGSRPAL